MCCRWKNFTMFCIEIDCSVKALAHYSDINQHSIPYQLVVERLPFFCWGTELSEYYAWPTFYSCLFVGASASTLWHDLLWYIHCTLNNKLIDWLNDWLTSGRVEMDERRSSTCWQFYPGRARRVGVCMCVCVCVCVYVCVFLSVFVTFSTTKYKILILQYNYK